MELFEDNAEEYIRRDLESSDVDTRRRAAVELVRALCRSFEQQVIQSFSQFISSMLQVRSIFYRILRLYSLTCWLLYPT